MTPWLDDGDVRLYHGDNLDVLRAMPDRSVHMCVTSPPFFGLRDYGTATWTGGEPDCEHEGDQRWYTEKSAMSDTAEAFSEAGPANAARLKKARWREKGTCVKCGAVHSDQQIGLEDTPDLWVERLVAVFREVRRVLRDDGTLWVEIGDSYTSGGRTWPTPEQIAGGKQATSKSWMEADPNSRPPTPAGLKQKDMIGQPWLLAFALRADGWYLRSEIIWARPNPMPESVTDRPTKSHSTVFLLSKQPRYFYDADAIREPHQHDGRHVTTVVGKENSEQHRNGERWPGSGANARSVWTVPTQPTPFAHFATWPEALVRRMILAGTSERGCCPECGAPWTRDTESELVKSPKHGAGSVVRGRGEGTDVNGWAGEAMPRLNRHVTTTGWSPSCAHALEPVPCTVLDPFAGSATTMLVARNHGRHSIGIELNESYLEIAAKRLQQLSLLS